jgi:hypothetical protein
MVHSLTGVTGPNGDYSFWFMTDLGVSKSLKTVFIVNRSDNGCNLRMGNSYVCMGDNPNGPKTSGNNCTT